MGLNVAVEMSEQWMETQRRQAAELVEQGATLREAVELWSDVVIGAALARSGHNGRQQNQCRAAIMLGVHRNTLNRHR